MFLNSRLKSTVKVFWWIMSVIIIVSMILLYTPLPFLNQQSQPQTSSAPQERAQTQTPSQEPTTEVQFDLNP